MTKEQYVQWLFDKTMLVSKEAETPNEQKIAWDILKWSTYVATLLVPSLGKEVGGVNIQEDVPESPHLDLSPALKTHIISDHFGYDFSFFPTTWEALLEDEEAMDFVYNSFCNLACNADWCDHDICPLDTICNAWNGNDNRKARLQDCMKTLRKAEYIITSDGN